MNNVHSSPVDGVAGTLRDLRHPDRLSDVDRAHCEDAPSGLPIYPQKSKVMTASTKAPHPDQLAHVEQLLEHFEQLEEQFQQVREGLTHSHRLATLGTIAS